MRAGTGGTMHIEPLRDVPRLADGAVDVERAVMGLRRLGRLHRFESPRDIPGGTGWSYLCPAQHRMRPLAEIDDIDEWRQRLGLGTDADPNTDLPPFRGGLVVALPYDRTTPGLSAVAEPVDTVLAVRGETVWLILRAFPGFDPPDPAGITAAIREAPPPHPSRMPRRRTVHASAGRDEFTRGVDRAQHHIADGDVYVVNLSLRLSATWPGDVHDLYRALRSRSAAPHGFVIERSPGTGLAGVSPETFLRAHGRHVEVRPIKGTRPRDPDPGRDAALAEELAASPKERAENTMIVDLERNDLGRVCETGSIHVAELCAVEAHPTVWQLVSTVRGHLRDDIGYGRALDACFPCGSVTGAPKISAMNIIASIETVPREWYCGAVGWISDGAMDTAVTIRTAVLDTEGTATYGTGSGIVADSDRDAEYEETWTKAAPFLAATNARANRNPTGPRSGSQGAGT